MLPSAPQTTSGDSHVTSHDSDSALSTLSTALRLSIAGETLDQDTTELQSSISDMVNHKEPALVVPDDVPVDLRVKLAVSMIQLGKTVPEVRLNYNSIAILLLIFHLVLCCSTFSTCIYIYTYTGSASANIC